MHKDILYTCISCGFKTFKEVLSEYEICPICNWQDSSGGMGKPFKSPFGNGDKLYNYQQNILKEIPYDIKKYKKGKNIYYRNLLWKPIDKNKLDSNHDYFPVWKFEEFHDKYPNNSNYHKKLMEKAQKYNPDEIIHIKYD